MVFAVVGLFSGLAGLAGITTMLLGLAAVAASVWLSTLSLTLFIIGGAIRISPPEKRAETVAAIYVASFIGLSAPIIGAGIALTEGVSPRVTLLGLAILIAAGIVLSAIKLLSGAHRRNPRDELVKRSAS